MIARCEIVIVVAAVGKARLVSLWFGEAFFLVVWLGSVEADDWGLRMD